MERPKVLILSVECWNPTTGSDTFVNLFSGYDPNRVANVYFKNGVPDTTVCNRFFCISENSVIKSIFNNKIKTGMEVIPEVGNTSSMKKEVSIEKRRYSFFSRYRLWIFLLGRELLWKLGRWNSKELDEFVESFSPDYIFFAIEGYIYIDRVILYVLEHTNKPAIGIMWDDNFSYKVNPHNMGFLFYRYLLRKKVKKLVYSCKKVFAIDPKLQFELNQEYGIDAELLTKGAEIRQTERVIQNINNPIEICYTGKLNLGRLKTVQLLANALHKLNEDEVKYVLKIYSGTQLNDKELESLNRNGVSFMGCVPQNEVADIQSKSDILLFVEALEGKHKYEARLSFSTKLVDYLSSGKCVLAIGPRDIAPIEYLCENDIAIVCNTAHEMEIELEQLTFKKIYHYGKKAFEFAKSHHDIADIQTKLYSSFEAIEEH